MQHKMPNLFTVFVNKGDKRAAYIKNVIRNNHMWAGKYSKCGDPVDASQFETNNVLYHNNACILIIGSFCEFAPHVTFIMDRANHTTEAISLYYFPRSLWDLGITEQNVVYKGPTIVGNDVWIGYRATIMPGVIIGDGAVIGAFSVVTKDVAPYTVVAGNPARVIRKRFSKELIDHLLSVQWWCWPDRKLRAAVPLLSDFDDDFIQESAQIAAESRMHLPSYDVIVQVFSIVNLSYCLAAISSQTVLGQTVYICDVTEKSVLKHRRSAQVCAELTARGVKIIFAKNVSDVLSGAECTLVVSSSYIMHATYVENLLHTLYEHREFDIVCGRIVQNIRRGPYEWFGKWFGLPIMSVQYAGKPGLNNAGFYVQSDELAQDSVATNAVNGPYLYRTKIYPEMQRVYDEVYTSRAKMGYVPTAPSWCIDIIDDPDWTTVIRDYLGRWRRGKLLHRSATWRALCGFAIWVTIVAVVRRRYQGIQLFFRLLLRR